MSNGKLILMIDGTAENAWTSSDASETWAGPHATGEHKPRHDLAQGYGFASINYRLVPAATLEEQAQDVANALAFLIGQAHLLG